MFEMSSGNQVNNIPVESRAVMLYGFANPKLLKAARLPIAELADSEVLVRVRAWLVTH
jgi:hypothetical protein